MRLAVGQGMGRAIGFWGSLSIALAALFAGESAAFAFDVHESGLPIVAPESQLEVPSEPGAQVEPKDARWLKHPLGLGLAATLAFPQTGDLFLLDGIAVDYALPYVSFNGSLGYLNGLDASLSARGRLHLGHAVALTLGARTLLVPFEDTCFLDFGMSDSDDRCSEHRHWSNTLFAGGELGIEGRSESGFTWHAGFGFFGLAAHGAGTCQPDWRSASMPCVAGPVRPGVVQTMDIALGWAL